MSLRFSVNILKIFFQVQINLAKDVFKKVETNYEQHKEYEVNLKKARDWIETAKEIVWASSENASLTTSKEELESRLDKVKFSPFIDAVNELKFYNGDKHSGSRITQ